MKREALRALCALPVFCAAALFGGCAPYGNDRSQTGVLVAEESGTAVSFYGVPSLLNGLGGEAALVYDKSEGTLSFREVSAELSAENPVVLDGNDFPQYTWTVAEGYESLLDGVLALAEGEPHVQAYAIRTEKGVLGLCNVYTGATGYLSGGGQIDAEKLARGIFFSWDGEEITVLDEVQKGGIVAFGPGRFVYFFKRNYYAKAVGAEESAFLCGDVAYDTGVNHTSHASFGFTGEYFLVRFYCGFSDYRKDYELYRLFTLDGRELASLRIDFA